MLENSITETIMSATAKALATTGPHGVNVVPVSVVQIHADKVYLYDFFMQKTIANIQASPTVALSAWNGLSGVQVKATAVYITTGTIYQQAVHTMQQQFPDRTLRGVIELTPTAVYDVSADVQKAGTHIA